MLVQISNGTLLNNQEVKIIILDNHIYAHITQGTFHVKFMPEICRLLHVITKAKVTLRTL